ncbi:MAG: hypothetical protein HYY60_01100 [Parcubacteria group bacterium]|nr:hypothetical protein [Parcubacteria group bacterium]MBI3074962.1 hypothetical protein [Parcubacteria group bacterium]
MKAVLDLKIILSAIVAIVIFGYAYHRTGDLIRGPRVTVAVPRNGAILTEPLLRIAGTASNAVALSINGRAVFTNESGEFNDEILLARGYNVFEISAEDRFGRTATEKIEVVRK